MDYHDGEKQVKDLQIGDALNNHGGDDRKSLDDS